MSISESPVNKRKANREQVVAGDLYDLSLPQRANDDGSIVTVEPPADAISAEKTSIPHMMQAFYLLFVVGMNDANIGIIIPSVKAHYNLSQPVVSVIFLCITFGNFSGAFMNGYLIQKTSQRVTAVIGTVALFVGFLICLFAVPFPAMCVAKVIVGFGNSLVDASANVVCGEMPRGTLILNFLHAIYGAGALIAPLTASALLDRDLSWTFTYVYLAGLAFVMIVTTAYFFRDMKTRAEREQLHHRNEDSNDVDRNIDKTVIIQALKNRTTAVGAMFSLFYVGAEVTLGSWGYTFLITVRSTDTVMMAQVMSAYWAGLCAGRLFLAYWTLKFGEKLMVYCYLCLTVGMLFVFWFVPTVAASVAALAILGIALGPMYPTAISVANKTVPVRLYAVSIGFIAAFGSGGAAMFPYITGVMMGARGVSNTLAPFCIALAIAMIAAWFLIPNPTTSKKANEERSSNDIELASITDDGISTRLRTDSSLCL